MADVFISYKSERRAAAEHLAEILADYGYSVWWDYGLISGRDFGAQIEKELRSAKAVVVLWCSLSVDSEWVREEAALAKRLDRIIPTFIEKIDLPLGFSLSQTLDLSDWNGAPQSNKLERLLRDIGGFVGRAPQSNLEGLDRTERAWRRFGSPTLREFALIDALERKAPPRTLPSALHPQAADPPPKPPPREPDQEPPKSRSGVMVRVLVAAALALIAVGFAASRWLPSLITSPAEEQTAATQRGDRPTDARHCDDCPDMFVVSAGSFTMGSPAGEANRGGDEGPQRRVTFARDFAVGRFEVTRGQYAAFVRDTGRAEGGNCYTINAGGYPEQTASATWRNPGFMQGDDHPVVCVSWEDAQAYVAWLNTRTRGGYRLLSEAEWEYAARAGTTAPFAWGSDANAGCTYGNGADATTRARYASTCNDGALNTAPAGSYRANAIGLSDMFGNAAEWTQDCYEASLESVPSNGSANETGACSFRVFRGSSWYYGPQGLRSAARSRDAPTVRSSSLGFRVARTLD